MIPTPRAFLEHLQALGLEAGRLLGIGPVDPDPVVTVTTSAALQAALDQGGEISLDPGRIFDGNFVVRTSQTTIRGNGAVLAGTSGPALHVLPGVSDVRIEVLEARSAFDVVVLLGDNDIRTQGTLAQVPRRIVLDRVTVPTHRGKRAFEINAGDVELLNCEVGDTYDPALRDSQAICILNSPGPVRVSGGSYSAGSEIIMSGGDVMKIPGIHPTDLIFENLLLCRPLSWRTDGVNRVVKNCFELKDADGVIVRDVVMRGSWKAGQDGYAIVITPRTGGAIRNVLFERVTIRDVGAGLQLAGHNRPGDLPTPWRTTGIVFRDSTIVAHKGTYGGRGLLALLGMSPDSLEFDNVVFVGDGTSVIYNGDDQRVGRLRMTGSAATTGTYGIMGAGLPNLTDYASWLDQLEVTGNTFTGAAGSLQKAIPSNTFVTRTAFDAIVAPRLG